VPTIITHAFVGTALGQLGPPAVPWWRLAFALAVLSVLPDLDVVAFHFHIPYSHWLGHRGLSHSLFFAVVVAAVVALVEFGHLRPKPAQWRLVLGLCILALASHGLLDALTDGGLGVGFFLPFDSTRYFFPFRPLQVAPVGVSNFLAGPALAVLRTEFLFVWLPVTGVVAVRKLIAGRPRCPTRRCR
jgi:inner membrane protein